MSLHLFMLYSFHVMNFQLNLMFAVCCVLCLVSWLVVDVEVNTYRTMCLSTITFSLLFVVDSS